MTEGHSAWLDLEVPIVSTGASGRNRSRSKLASMLVQLLGGFEIAVRLQAVGLKLASACLLTSRVVVVGMRAGCKSNAACSADCPERIKGTGYMSSLWESDATLRDYCRIRVHVFLLFHTGEFSRQKYIRYTFRRELQQ